MFTVVSAAATAKNGAVRNKCRRIKGVSPIFVAAVIGTVSNGCNHQIITSSNTGSTATDPLLSIANENAARLSQYQECKDEG